MITGKILTEYGAVETIFEKDDFLFEVGMSPNYYYYIVSGQVKLNIYDDDNKEFIFSFYQRGHNLGEGSIFLNKKYICNAIAVETTSVLILAKDLFLLMLKENYEEFLKISHNLANKLYFQEVMAPTISSQDAEKRVMTLLNYLKTKWTSNTNEKYTVDLTRQEIADMTGLRVETVIRTIRKLKDHNELKVVNSKIIL